MQTHNLLDELSVADQAEQFLQVWHTLTIDHGDMHVDQRSILRNRLTDLSAEVSRSQGCTLSFTSTGARITIAPPGAQLTVAKFFDVAAKMNPGTWTIRHATGAPW